MNKGTEHHKEANGYAGQASQTVEKAGQAMDQAVTSASSKLGTYFDRHPELQGWIMMAAGVFTILYMLNLVSFMRYVFFAVAAYLILYGMYKSRAIDYMYATYQGLTSYFDKRSNRKDK